MSMDEVTVQFCASQQFVARVRHVDRRKGRTYVWPEKVVPMQFGQDRVQTGAEYELGTEYLMPRARSLVASPA